MASSFHSSLPMSLGQKRSAAAKKRNVLKRAAAGRPRKYITDELQIELQANPNKWKLAAKSVGSSEGTRLKKQAAALGLTAKFVSTKMEKTGDGADARYKYTGDIYVSLQTAPMSLYS